VPARRDTNGGIYAIFAAEQRSHSADRQSRIHLPTKPRTRRIVFWSATVIPFLAIVSLGLSLGGAAPTVAKALLHAPLAPVAVFVLHAVTWLYFLPLALHGVSPSPVFAGFVVYLIAGLALLGWRKRKQAVIVLFLPLLCTIPLSFVGLGSADGQADNVKAAFSRAMTEQESLASFNVTQIDYRFLVFDASGSKATVASVVTMVDASATSPGVIRTQQAMVFKDDKAAQMVKLSSGEWRVASLEEDFHPGYEP
jgi:hypothetical protein